MVQSPSYRGYTALFSDNTVVYVHLLSVQNSSLICPGIPIEVRPHLLSSSPLHEAHGMTFSAHTSHAQLANNHPHSSLSRHSQPPFRCKHHLPAKSTFEALNCGADRAGARRFVQAVHQSFPLVLATPLTRLLRRTLPSPLRRMTATSHPLCPCPLLRHDARFPAVSPRTGLAPIIRPPRFLHFYLLVHVQRL